MAGDIRDMDRLRFLDALRGLAVLTVMVEHGLEQSVPGFTNWAAHWFSPGQAGVCLFLLISGFIIPVSVERGGSNARFWWRRFWRLMPLYWVSIGLALLCPVTPREARTWLVNLTMLQDFLGQPHILGVFWTLTLELILYLTCSVLFAVGLLRRTTWVIGLAAGGYLGLGVLGLASSRSFGHGRTFLLLTALVGMAFQRLIERKMRLAILGVTLLVVAAGLALSILSANRVGSFVVEFDLLALLTAWGLAYAVFSLGVAGRRWRWPTVLVAIGQISYSLYLMHPLVLAWMPPGAAWIYMPMFFAITLVLSMLTYRLIERPCIHLGRQLERQAKARPGLDLVSDRRAA